MASLRDAFVIRYARKLECRFNLVLGGEVEASLYGTIRLSFPKLAKRFGNALARWETPFPVLRSGLQRLRVRMSGNRETEFQARCGIPKALR